MTNAAAVAGDLGAGGSPAECACWRDYQSSNISSVNSSNSHIDVTECTFEGTLQRQPGGGDPCNFLPLQVPAVQQQLYTHKELQRQPQSILLLGYNTLPRTYRADTFDTRGTRRSSGGGVSQLIPVSNRVRPNGWRFRNRHGCRDHTHIPLVNLKVADQCVCENREKRSLAGKHREQLTEGLR
jgi:hypothetical protein